MRGWLAAAGVLLAGPALAQEHPCGGALTQSELNQCTYLAWQEADAELNRAYAAAIEAARRSEEARLEETLRAAQRAWVAHRDAACEAEAAVWDGGTGEPMIRNGCLEGLTLQRTEDLWTYLE